jgi:hypothetical protein
MATKLISERLYLTALELHIELLESGREIVKLRDFFSNPANFERTGALRTAGAVLGENSPPRLARTASIQTFDSLDFARSSDDGERNDSDRIAVLEFELRKTHETIRSLRAALTRTAASEAANDAEPATTPTNNIPSIDEPARPYERRALNFLINEYLLRHDYKLTSVTFSEENVNQDFDDWDDVGINVAKPPGLVHIYREYGQPRGSNRGLVVETCDVACMADSSDAESEVQEDLRNRISTLDDRIRSLEVENANLVSTIQHLESSTVRVHARDPEFHALQSTPVASPIRFADSTPDVRIKGIKLEVTEVTDSAETEMDGTETTAEDSVDHNKADALYETALDSLHGAAPDDRVDDPEKNSGAETQPSLQSSSGTLRQESELVSPASTAALGRSTPNGFRQALLKAVFNVLPDNRIYTEVSRIAEQNQNALDEVVPLLARCLPYVVPNVLLAGRDELIPLIVCSAALHSDSKTRDQLLNILFNLIKRPDVDQRRMILVGCVAFARHAGAARVESELLPQCWEQIAHKHVERRLLVAEACGALTPHVPAELRSSLILSMLQQMLEDGSEEVREATVRSFGVLVGFVEDADKYPPVESLFFAALGDVSERVTVAVHQVFLPSLAVWSMELGRLETGLMSAFVGRIQKLLVGGSSASHSAAAVGVGVGDQHQFCLLVNTLYQLMPILFASFLSCAPFAGTVSVGADGDSKGGSAKMSAASAVARHSIPKLKSDLLDAGLVLGSQERYEKLVGAYEAYIGEEWYHPWHASTWLANELVLQLKSVAESLSASDQTIVHVLADFFRTVCHTFGCRFALTVIRPQFQKSIRFPSAQVTEMSLVEHATLIRCIAPVYAVGVLAAFSQDEDRSELSRFLTEYIQVTALHRCSLVGVNAAIVELCAPNEHSSGLPDLLLSVLWDCIMNESPLIRSAAGRCFEPAVRAGGIAEQQVGSRIVPALVTLAGDTDPEVRASTVGGLGAIVECVSGRAILDKVYMQLQSLMDDPAYRDELALSTALIRALGRAGPSAEPRFRDDFILPRLTALAVQNSSGAPDVTTRRTEIALALFDAYSSVSCCFVGDQLVSEVLLPGLKCLHRDLGQLAPDHAGVVASMIREFEDRADTGTNPGSMIRSVDASAAAANGGTGAVTTAGGGQSSAGDAIKSKMLSHIKDVKDRASYSNLNLSKIFTTTKK